MQNPYFDLELEKLIELLAQETESFALLSPILHTEEEIIGSKKRLNMIQAAIDLTKGSGAPA